MSSLGAGTNRDEQIAATAEGLVTESTAAQPRYVAAPDDPLAARAEEAGNLIQSIEDVSAFLRSLPDDTDDESGGIEVNDGFGI